MKFNLPVLLLATITSAISYDKIERVIFLGLDGTGNFNTKINVPTINKLLQSGAYTNYASAMDPTWSAQNWGSMFHGVIPSKHGLTNAIAQTKPYPEDSPYPSVFKIIHDKTPNVKMASFAMWNAINDGIIEQSVPMYRDKTEPDDNIFPHMLDYLHIDETGHEHQWMSEEYIARYIKTDGYIKQILDTLDDMKIRDSTLIIMTADHGGVGYGHGGTSDKERNIMWGVNGPGIKSKKLKDKSVTNMDVGAIMLKALGYEVPSYFDSKFPSTL
ncbi:alkaline phosphatase-like protein [Conidiobolus coronatus NRRL 28638]|uniref:Alkaline phosphatase-like protein n=1 Tax=Conidiobolus coronatus (strain ATCC 28846 / CBS 209.66 / NRRL 28638) TaxID=796925 RepID=A0A137NUG5_CONC2|nr:alkaline phosphatase-like protein [Conidiobolus coronatus NRRL 28638]|eukprot:KXN66455.1 alkaline phosphatase-like protein [Conidiobolus coronatus NRRL 28638]